MKQSAKRFLSSVVSLLLVVAALTIFANFSLPAYREMVELKGKLWSMEALRQEQEAVIKNLQNLIAAYGEAQEVQQTVSLALPLEPELAGALAQLNGLVSVNNLSPQAYTIAAPAAVLSEEARRAEVKREITFQPFNVGTVNFGLRLAGSYGDFKKFLSQLETNVRVFDIKSLSLHSAGRPEQDTYNFELTVATYYQPQPD